MQKLFYTILFVYLCIFHVVEVRASSIDTTISATKNDKKSAAVDFIEALVNEALEIVNHSSMPDDEKRKKLSECINKYLDIERITPSVFSRLGYNDLSSEDKEKVKQYLKKYLIRFYASKGKLSAMVGAKLSSKPSAESRGEDFAVTTQFAKDSSPSIKIVWIIKNQKVYYVEIEDFNQIPVLRDEMKVNIGSGTLMDYINKQ